MALPGQILRRFFIKQSVKHFSLRCNQRSQVFQYRETLKNSCVPASSIPSSLLVIQKRFKYSKQAKFEEESSDEEDNDFGKEDENSKIVTGRMSSLRADNVLKSGLSLPRNKVELMFYEGRIRVNGNAISKKSQKVMVGDEVDLIKGFSQLNENFLIISRVFVLSCRENEEGSDLVVKLRRFKSLTVENYADDPWNKPKTD